MKSPEVAAANSAATAAPVSVQVASTDVKVTSGMQPDLGNAIREKNITSENGSNASAMRYDHSNSDFCAASATNLPGFDLHMVVVPTIADRANGDFTIMNSGPWNNWFPGDMPFNPSLSKAWTPD